MTTTNRAIEYCKTISDSDLLMMLEFPDEYQPEAVEAARNEIIRRQLTAVEMDAAKEIVQAVKLERQLQQESADAKKARLHSNVQSLFETLNPIQTGTQTTEKTIRFIVLGFSLIFLYHFIVNFRLYWIELKDLLEFRFSAFMTICLEALLPTSIILFWKRKPAGWMLLMTYLTFSVIGEITLLIQAFAWHPWANPGMDRFLFQRPSLSRVFMELLFLIGVVYIISKGNIRDVFAIGKPKMGITIAISVVLSVLLPLVKYFF
jgi:hypothetical protein